MPVYEATYVTIFCSQNTLQFCSAAAGIQDGFVQAGVIFLWLSNNSSTCFLFPFYPTDGSGGISTVFQWCQDFDGTGRAGPWKNGPNTLNLLLLLTSGILE